ncbi:RNA polymerase sigma factor [Nonomuraea rubra]|uniref:RNA polymerase sigma factor n=1 Tax=Nonomuraea rubra TaxID=46180 RepID=UPI003606C02C
MWRTLSDDARQAIRDLCDKHGARLYDYCRTELAAGDAQEAVAAAAMTVHLYADRVVDPALRRPWLYAVARAHRAVVAKPASIGSWSRPGRMSELLPEALLSLERPQRELLDLSVRHGLADRELAAVFELPEPEVRAIVMRAAAALEEWFAAIVAARSRDGCPELTARMAEWVAAPGRRARARIGRHIQSCASCRAAPRTMTAGALLRRLPIAALPGTLPNRLALAQPLPGEGPLWRADGFPVQARTLVETGSSSPAPPVADATPSAPVAGPTTATPGKPWSAAGAAAADQEPPGSDPERRGTEPGRRGDDLERPAAAASSAGLEGPAGGPVRPGGDPEGPGGPGGPGRPGGGLGHPGAPAVRGRHPFTPPSRTRPFRGGAYGDKLVYTTVTKGESNGTHHNGVVVRYGGITLSALEQAPNGGGAQWQEYWRPPADDDDDPEPGTPIRAVARLGLILGVGLLAAGLIWAVLNAQAHPATLTKAAAQTSVPPVEPEPRASGVAPSTAPGSALTSVPRKSALPRPAAPVARLSPSSLWLGRERSGTFSLSCTGRCEITSASGTDGIAVTGNRIRIRSPRDFCDVEPGVHRGKVAVRWTGRATGDGRTTGGVTTGGGTLTMNVAWTVGRATDDGVLMADDRGARSDDRVLTADADGDSPSDCG